MEAFLLSENTIIVFTREFKIKLGNWISASIYIWHDAAQKTGGLHCKLFGVCIFLMLYYVVSFHLSLYNSHFYKYFFFSFSGQIFHRSWWRALSLHFRLFAKQKTCLTGKLSGNKAFVHGSRILRTSKVIYKIHNKWLFFKSDTTSHIYYRSETASPLLGTLKEWNLPNNISLSLYPQVYVKT